MIAPQIVTEIRRLLAVGGLSQRKIAERMGVCRGTVHAIASGRRPDYEPLPRTDDDEESAGPAARCPGCGGMVYLPCRLCRMRRTLAQKLRVAPRGRAIEPFQPADLDLRPDHRARYEEVRTGRCANNDHVTQQQVGP